MRCGAVRSAALCSARCLLQSSLFHGLSDFAKVFMDGTCAARPCVLAGERHRPFSSYRCAQACATCRRSPPHSPMRCWTRYPTRHGIPRGMVSYAARYPTPHGIPRRTVSHVARYPTRHGIPPGTVSHPARYPTRHGIPPGTVSHPARYPTRHGIPHGTVSHSARYPTRHAQPLGRAVRFTMLLLRCVAGYRSGRPCRVG